MKATINVEASKTKNYQKYTVGITTEVVLTDVFDGTKEITDEKLGEVIAKYQAICRKKVSEQIELDKI